MNYTRRKKNVLDATPYLDIFEIYTYVSTIRAYFVLVIYRYTNKSSTCQIENYIKEKKYLLLLFFLIIWSMVVSFAATALADCFSLLIFASKNKKKKKKLFLSL